jgi:hypothetical protein
MSAWTAPMQRVGAKPAGPSAGAGVSALSSMAKSSGLSKMSATTKGIVWSTELAIKTGAGGDVGLATGLMAAQVLAAAAYFTVKAISQSVSAAVEAAAKTGLEIAGDVPIVGFVIDMIALGVQLGAPGDMTEEQIISKCGGKHWRVVSGSGPGNEVMPGDLFMGFSVNDDGKERPDAFTLFGSPQPHNATDLAELLICLEEHPDAYGYGKAASTFWPGQGLTTEERTWLKQLRQGMSALYVNPVTKQSYTIGQTDGGSMLWVPYIDILTQAWRDKRLTEQWLQFRLLELQTRYAARATLDLYLYRKAQGASDPLKQTRASVVAGKKLFNQPCSLFDQRTVKQVLSEKGQSGMIMGWWKRIDASYTQFKDPNGNPMDPWQAKDNPLHGPSYKTEASALDSLLALGLVGAAGLGAAWFFKPALVAGGAAALGRYLRKVPPAASSAASTAGSVASSTAGAVSTVATKTADAATTVVEKVT